jgi:hypothetical protein
MAAPAPAPAPDDSPDVGVLQLSDHAFPGFMDAEPGDVLLLGGGQAVPNATADRVLVGTYSGGSNAASLVVTPAAVLVGDGSRGAGLTTTLLLRNTNGSNGGLALVVAGTAQGGTATLRTQGAGAGAGTGSPDGGDLVLAAGAAGAGAALRLCSSNPSTLGSGFSNVSGVHYVGGLRAAAPSAFGADVSCAGFCNVGTVLSAPELVVAGRLAAPGLVAPADGASVQVPGALAVGAGVTAPGLFLTLDGSGGQSQSQGQGLSAVYLSTSGGALTGRLAVTSTSPAGAVVGGDCVGAGTVAVEGPAVVFNGGTGGDGAPVLADPARSRWRVAAVQGGALDSLRFDCTPPHAQSTPAMTTAVLELTAGGGVYNAANSATFSQLCDARLKSGIADADLPTCLDRIGRLRLRRFVYDRAPSRRVTGLVAQEVRTVFPEAVAHQAGGGCECECGRECGCGCGPLAINLDQLTMALFGAVQQLRKDGLRRDAEIAELRHLLVAADDFAGDGCDFAGDDCDYAGDDCDDEDARMSPGPCCGGRWIRRSA